MVKEDEGVVAAVSSGGKSSLMVCTPSDGSGRQKVCMDIDTAEQTKETKKQTAENKGQLDNNTYNIMEQLTNENKSLWRIKNNYKQDAKEDAESRQLWDFIEKDKEELVKLLTSKLRDRL